MSSEKTAWSIDSFSLDLKPLGLVTDICMIDDDGDEDEDGEWVRLIFDTKAVLVLSIPLMEMATFILTDEMEEKWKPKKEE